MAKKKRKLRTDFRKNRVPRARKDDWTSQFRQHAFADKDTARDERVSGKGELTRQRTVVVEEDDERRDAALEVDAARCLAGRVLKVHGLTSLVAAADGRRFHCATRRILKTLATDERHVVVAGDRVSFRPAEPLGDPPEGIIERIEPRQGTINRESRGRRHVLVTNVDQLLIVASAAEPDIKPHLIDRFLVEAERTRIEPVVCINKVDLVELPRLLPLAGTYAQMGYCVLLTSTKTGLNVERLRQRMRGRQTAVTGQSGVGKSSLLNAVDPELCLPVSEVSRETQKGKHTTTTAQLLPLSCGGYVVDTPGIRQFKLWDVIAEEVAGFMRDIRPFVARCRYPDCTHTHEDECAVKDAVADDLLDARRYESFCHLASGD